MRETSENGGEEENIGKNAKKEERREEKEKVGEQKGDERGRRSDRIGREKGRKEQVDEEETKKRKWNEEEKRRESEEERRRRTEDMRGRKKGDVTSALLEFSLHVAAATDKRGITCRQEIPAELIRDLWNRTRQLIHRLPGLKSPGLSSNPQLNSVIRSINTSCQRKDVQLMNVTLDIYMRIFSSILHHNKPGAQTLLGQVSDSKRPQVESALKGLEKKMKELKQRLDHQNPDSEDVMRNLNKIKVNDLVVQKQALAQYKEIYQAASVIRGRCGPARHRRR
ncbi:hypothetical protein D9C73_024578 [Collichthys lucidus]|uniref:Uncharacterized protein n=1 Tax=Collichthys lucidus TaxID=240159 RepID=A0A4U5VPL7_COLLU|nr:hypothetical protein D9C73_024578 [Collichthys lucidus]